MLLFMNFDINNSIFQEKNKKDNEKNYNFFSMGK